MKRDLRVFQEEATAQIKALQASERTLKAEMEELRELLGDLQRQLKEKTTQLETAETQVQELLCTWKERVLSSERSRSPPTVGESINE